MTPTDAQSEFNVHAFIAGQAISKIWTATVVKVMSVQPGGTGPVGMVDVLPCVKQIDGAGHGTMHGTIYGVPYLRMQGGRNAVIIDPQVGDLGVAVFDRRDNSSVIATKAPALPGSRRQFDPADALYLGGFLNAAPTQYVQFADDGQSITVVSPGTITLQAPTVAVQGDLTVSGAITAQGDVTGEGTSLHTHLHSGVQTGDGDTGPPV